MQGILLTRHCQVGVISTLKENPQEDEQAKLFSFENTVSKKYKKKHTNTQKCRPKDRISKKKNTYPSF